MNPQKPKPKNLKTLFFMFFSQKLNNFICKNKILIFLTPLGPLGACLYKFEKTVSDAKSADFEARSSLTHLRKETQ